MSNLAPLETDGNLRTQVIAAVSSIPSGRVATYGQIATMCGRPRAARQVGMILGGLGLEENSVPWWRIVNRHGFLSINHGEGGAEKEEQAARLRLEGVVVDEKFEVDLPTYLYWQPTRAVISPEIALPIHPEN